MVWRRHRSHNRASTRRRIERQLNEVIAKGEVDDDEDAADTQMMESQIEWSD
jgi:uncharacterized membrane protein